MLIGFTNHALAQGKRLIHKLALLQEIFFRIATVRIEKPVGSFGDGFRQLSLLIRENAIRIIEAEQEVAAYVQFLQEFRIRGFCDIHVAIVRLVAIGVILHRLLKRPRDADVVND